MRLGSCIVDLIAHEARWPERTETLTPAEVKLLAYLSGKQGQVASRQQLLTDVWVIRRQYGRARWTTPSTGCALRSS